MKDLFGKEIQEESFSSKKGKLRDKKNIGGRLWTKNKSELIDCYINKKFLFVTKRGVYIDAFAGHQYEDQKDSWAARLLWRNNKGRKSLRIERFELFELNSKSFKNMEAMVNETPADGRSIGLHHGDSNQLLPQMLKNNPIPSKMPTFCLLDQRNRECDWNLVKTIANHKGHEEGTKIELFYFLAIGWITRSIKTLKTNREEALMKWWGKDDYDTFAEGNAYRQAEILCKRFSEELGYKHVSQFPIYDADEGGKILYSMIHCSDHPRAIPLMESAYREVTGRSAVLMGEGEFDWLKDDLSGADTSISTWDKFIK